MRKYNEENERIKRRYLQYMRTANGRDNTTVVKAAEAILRFEESTNFASFKKFRIEQVLRFRDKLDAEISKRTGKPLAKSTIASILAANKAFFFWLADKPGYKSRIRISDADYFNMDAKGAVWPMQCEKRLTLRWTWHVIPLKRCRPAPTLKGADDHRGAGWGHLFFAAQTHQSD